MPPDLRATAHFSQRNNPGQSAVAVVFSDGRWYAEPIGEATNFDAIHHAIGLTVDKAGAPTRIATCMASASRVGHLPTWLEQKVSASGSALVFRHRREASEVFDRLGKIARRSLEQDASLSGGPRPLSSWERIMMD